MAAAGIILYVPTTIVDRTQPRIDMRFTARLSVRVLLLVALFIGMAFVDPAQLAYLQSDTLARAPVTRSDTPARYDEFDIRADHFATVDERVRRNETFSDILSRHGISHAAIADLARLAKPVLDVRRIRAGSRYRLYRDSTDGQVRFLVYQQNPVEYVVFEMGDTLRVEAGARDVTIVEKEIQGAIERSLYETLEQLDVSPVLAIELSEVFAWQVDFYRIMKGDRFSVVYEEQRVGDEAIGIGRIRAARFHHAGRDYYAFAHAAGGRVAYYDEKGNSLRRPFLKAPLKFTRISSRYSLRRFHPVQKRYKAHLGTDYAAPTGTPVRATADGVVIAAGYTKNNGRYVKIRHNSTYTTGYLHFSKIARGIKKGKHVSQGDTIGYVGSTGLATGPHLCYRFWKNGRQVDPLRQKLPDTVEPIDPAYRSEFEAIVAELKDRL